MYTIKKRSAIAIPRIYENEPFYSKIKGFLTRRVRDYHQESVYIVNKFYLETDKFLIIPRFFPVHEYIPECIVEDHSHIGEDINIDHAIKFRDPLQEDMANLMVQANSSTVQAPPGSGKTVVALYAVASRKKKTLVLVHRDTLVDQWAERVLEHTTIQKNDVVRLTSSNFELAFKKPFIVTTDQTFLSILKRNRLEFLKSLNDANIGIFIADEVHTSVGAPSFSECSLHVPARVVFGLSATPYRIDGNGDVITYHLGPVYVPKGKATTMDAKVTILLFDSGVLRKSYRYIYWADKFQRSRYLQQLKKSQTFMSITKGLLKKFANGRDLILVAERLKLIDNLYDWLSHPDKSKFVGSAGNEELVHKVVFATPGKIRDGVDIPKKDCVIMTSPIGNIEQMCGRVVRIEEGKSRPIVVDMVDIGVKDISVTLFRRIDYYEKKNWEISYFKIFSDGKYVPLQKSEALAEARRD